MITYNPYSLEGKVILVTGASSGIGRATAIECSKMGAQVILTARNKERLEDTLSEMEGTNHQIVVADLSTEEGIDNLVAQLPLLDGIVSNAGILKTLPIQFIKKVNLFDVLNVNTVAPILLIQSLYKRKKINKGGSVVFTSSAASMFADVGNAIYSSSKGAIDSFMRVAALELAVKKIRCNCVNPGMVETPLINKGTFTQEDKEREINRYPLKRYGEPTDIALAIVFLLSDASSWITGINLKIDGGVTL